MNKNLTSFLYQHEIIQAYIRILFISILLLSLFYSVHSNYEHLVKISHGASFYAIVFLVVAILHLIGLKKSPNQNILLRKYFILSIDILSVTLAIWFFGENGIIFNPLYIWIIIGYTIRFGRSFFPISLLGTYIAIAILATYHPFWINNPALTISVLIAITVIPLFVVKLQEEIGKKNIGLEQLLNEMEHRANHDELTTLPNRYYFYSKLHGFMEESSDFALLFLDLDGFKEVNDSHGHEKGDNVLKEVSQRLNIHLGQDTFIARLGGDEFVCIYKEYTKENLTPIIKKLLLEISKPYGENEDIKGISISIGVSQYPQDTKDSFELKNFADRAMYQAKRNGKNQMIYYHEMNEEVI